MNERLFEAKLTKRTSNVVMRHTIKGLFGIKTNKITLVTFQLTVILNDVDSPESIMYLSAFKIRSLVIAQDSAQYCVDPCSVGFSDKFKITI